jgi:predicted transposase YbfD/YdcC
MLVLLTKFKISKFDTNFLKRNVSAAAIMNLEVLKGIKHVPHEIFSKSQNQRNSSWTQKSLIRKEDAHRLKKNVGRNIKKIEEDDYVQDIFFVQVEVIS